MSHAFFANIARMRYIFRWGLMRNTMQDNIQEKLNFTIMKIWTDSWMY